MPSTIRRAYATIGQRQVHYRTSGSGPAFVLIHQSPRSSAELEPMIRFLSRDFQVIAPDTPGYGQSDPIAPPDTEPGIDEFVDALVGLFDVLDLERPLVFGTHTGAILGVRLATRYPHRVSALMANGILLNSEAERRDLCERYMPAFLPQWSGSHLTWVWSRNKDQFDFFPWYLRSHEARIHWPAGDNDLHDCVMDMMTAGDNYRSGYRAVLDYAIVDDLPRLQVPTQLLVARQDALSRYAELLPPLPDGVESLVLDDFADIPACVADFARRHADSSVTARFNAPAPAGSLKRYFQPVGTGDVHFLASWASTGERPLLLLHDAGLSADSLTELARALSGERSVIAPDLPGHGESRTASASHPKALAETLAEFLSTIGIDRCDVIAVGATAACALALKQASPSQVDKLVACNPALAETISHPEDFASLPDLSIDSSGAHLLRAWHYLRDRSLYSSWRMRNAETMQAAARPPTALALQRDVLALLKSHTILSHYLQATLQYRLEDFRQSGGTFAATEDFDAAGLGKEPIRLQADKVRWAPTLLALLND